MSIVDAADPREESDVADRRGVRSVTRALDILTAFSARHPRLQLRELADIVGLPKPSTHRIAVSLVERGFLRQESDGAYSLGGRLLELGGLVSTSSALSQLTRDAVAALAELTEETILVAEVDWVDRTLLVIRKRPATHPLAVTSPVGKRTHIGNGCIGKAVLGALEPSEADQIVPQLKLVPRAARSIVDHDEFRREVASVARRGFATDTHEFTDGVAGAAVAVGAGGRPLGALAIVAPATRAPRAQLERLGRLIRRTLDDTNRAYAADRS
ncbi:IclR family transcriptional regulator [Blastococcus haudaquaticus]|uniref:Glycerol operon regulatory protein n=1 Tax=Blastococcus haudaquaticus TaxID=1938745 RepID=A0A286GV49_9ACTN|nr:helix-turn-helix domain-containing protein [Blastococcus haudaquaticus]SOD99408.1 transcriptional regulator, IclR family [Blastococcus haudaquaticus]